MRASLTRCVSERPPGTRKGRDERKRAENEATFRAANERIRAAERELDPPLEYEKVLGDPRRYIIVPRHELPEYESVVGSGDGYDVVQKREGVPAELARDLNPRS